MLSVLETIKSFRGINLVPIYEGDQQTMIKRAFYDIAESRT